MVYLELISDLTAQVANSAVAASESAPAGGGHDMAYGLGFLVGQIGVYILPGIIASMRKHPKAGVIWIINILLGWTGFGWLWAIIWAFRSPAPQIIAPQFMTPAPQPVATAPVPSELSSEELAVKMTQLREMSDKDLISDDEFNTLRAQLLARLAL